MITPDQLDNWINYPVPTEETYPRYAAIRMAGDAFHDAVFGEVFRLRQVASLEAQARKLYESPAWSSQDGWVPWVRGGNALKQDDARREVGAYHSPSDFVPNYAVINLAARQFIVAIDTSAPDSADKTAAIRCVRLARNAANEALTAVTQEMDTPICAWVTADTMEAEAHRQAVLARFQANSAVACGGK